MAVDSVLGPFRPGPGGMPPYLAGRQTEQRLFRALLSDLSRGVPPPSEVVLWGPRGNGKTVLLGWLEEEAASFPGVEVLQTTPPEIADRVRLAEQLLPAVWWKRYTPSEIAAFGIHWKPGEDRPPPARAVLTARAQKAPLVLLLDEAHTLDPEVGRELLNASQYVGRRLPFLVVLAGTPNLESHLNSMSASFWNRARQLRIGRLDEGAAADAFGRPLREAGFRVDRGTLARMVEESQCYPFFIQVLGQAVWDQLATREAALQVTPSVLEAARPDFDKTRGAYYRHRLDELRKRGLLPVGRAVAEAFRDRSVLSDPPLENAVRAGLDETASLEEVQRATEAIGHLGYIWRAAARPEWEPGIPSLMDFIREHAPARASPHTEA